MISRRDPFAKLARCQDRNGNPVLLAFQTSKKLLRDSPPHIHASPRTHHLNADAFARAASHRGATCYLNSLIQTMFMTPEFRKAILAIKGTDLGVEYIESGSTSPQAQNEGKVRSKARTIPIELQRLFTTLQTETGTGCVSTKKLTDSFGWSRGAVSQQHDLSELNLLLMEAIHISLKNTACENLIESTYELKMAQEITCSVCGYVSARTMKERLLCLNVKGFRSIKESLKQYIKAEEMSGQNRYRCPRCSDLVDATKQLKLTSLPPVLTVCMLRFKFDWNRNVRIKLKDHVEFPPVLDMSEFMDGGGGEGASGDGKTRHGPSLVYDLLSVVIHYGNTNSGHYHAYIRDMYDSVAYPFDTKLMSGTQGGEGKRSRTPSRGRSVSASPAASPSTRSAPTSPSIRRKRFSEIEALELMIEAVSSSGTPQNAIGMEFKRASGGFTWNRSFAKQHGKLLEFIRNHGDFFVVSNRKIWLKEDKDMLKAMAASSAIAVKAEAAAAEKDAPASSDVDDGNGGGAGEETKSGDTAGALGEQKNGSVSEVKAESKSIHSPGTDKPSTTAKSAEADSTKDAAQPTPIPPGSRYGGWFDFNDSKVTAIHPDLIRAQFSGDGIDATKLSSRSPSPSSRRRGRSRGRRQRRNGGGSKKGEGECAYILVYRRRLTADPQPESLPPLPDWIESKRKTESEAEDRLCIGVTFMDVRDAVGGESGGSSIPRRYPLVVSRFSEPYTSFIGRMADMLKDSNPTTQPPDASTFIVLRQAARGKMTSHVDATDGSMHDAGIKRSNELYIFFDSGESSGKDAIAACRERLTMERKRQNACLPIDIRDTVSGAGDLALFLGEQTQVKDIRAAVSCRFYPPPATACADASTRLETLHGVAIPDTTRVSEIDLKTTKWILKYVDRPPPGPGRVALRVRRAANADEAEFKKQPWKHALVSCNAKIDKKLCAELCRAAGVEGSPSTFEIRVSERADALSEDGSVTVSDLKWNHGQVVHVVRKLVTEVPLRVFLYVPSEAERVSLKQMPSGGDAADSKQKTDSKDDKDTASGTSPSEASDIPAPKQQTTESSSDGGYLSALTGFFSRLSLGSPSKPQTSAPMETEEDQSERSGQASPYPKDEKDNVFPESIEWGEPVRPLPGTWRALPPITAGRNSNVAEGRALVASVIGDATSAETQAASKHLRLTLLTNQGVPSRIWREGGSIDTAKALELAADEIEGTSSSKETAVGAFVTDPADDPGSHWRIVVVRRFDSERRLYGPGRLLKLVSYDRKDDDTLVALKVQVASIPGFGDIPVEDMVLAFYRPSKRNWKILKGKGSATGNGWQTGGRRRKKKKKKKKRRRAPAKGPVQDILSQCGDHTVVGVADKRTISLKDLDFMTEEDERARSASKSSGGGDGGLSIAVDISSSSSDSEGDK